MANTISYAPLANAVERGLWNTTTALGWNYQNNTDNWYTVSYDPAAAAQSVTHRTTYGNGLGLTLEALQEARQQMPMYYYDGGTQTLKPVSEPPKKPKTFNELLQARVNDK